jgi:hypothetical protein
MYQLRGRTPQVPEKKSWWTARFRLKFSLRLTVPPAVLLFILGVMCGTLTELLHIYLR